MGKLGWPFRVVPKRGEGVGFWYPPHPPGTGWGLYFERV